MTMTVEQQADKQAWSQAKEYWRRTFPAIRWESLDEPQRVAARGLYLAANDTRNHSKSAHQLRAELHQAALREGIYKLRVAALERCLQGQHSDVKGKCVVCGQEVL